MLSSVCPSVETLKISLGSLQQRGFLLEKVAYRIQAVEPLTNQGTLEEPVFLILTDLLFSHEYFSGLFLVHVPDSRLCM